MNDAKMLRFLLILSGVLVAGAEWVQLPPILPSSSQATDEDNNGGTSGNKSESSQSAGMASLISEMKTAYQNLRSSINGNRSPRTLAEKFQYLEKLRIRMLQHIATTAMQLHGSSRQRRTAADRGGHGGGGGWSSGGGGGGWHGGGGHGGGGHGGGHGGHSKGLGFPSIEATLLSLAFLVFGVFLVNLVQQLLFYLQSTSASIGRKKRSIEAEEALRVLQALEEFPQHHRQETGQCYNEDWCGEHQDDFDSPMRHLAKFLLNLKS